jgi:hypothetical protein
MTASLIGIRHYSSRELVAHAFTTGGFDQRPAVGAAGRKAEPASP